MDRKVYKSERYYRLRLMVLDALGGRCCKCGFSDFRALQIDHINGGGIIDRHKMSKGYHESIVKSFLANENKYQLLCANCNWIKRSENNENRK